MIYSHCDIDHSLQWLAMGWIFWASLPTGAEIQHPDKLCGWSSLFGIGSSFPKNKMAKDLLPPSSILVMDMWSYTTIPLYLFMAWCLHKQKGKFIFLPSLIAYYNDIFLPVLLHVSSKGIFGVEFSRALWTGESFWVLVNREDVFALHCTSFEGWSTNLTQEGTNIRMDSL